MKTSARTLYFSVLCTRYQTSRRWLWKVDSLSMWCFHCISCSHYQNRSLPAVDESFSGRTSGVRRCLRHSTSRLSASLSSYLGQQVLAFGYPVDTLHSADSKPLPLLTHVLRLGSADTINQRLPHGLPYSPFILVIVLTSLHIRCAKH